MRNWEQSGMKILHTKILLNKYCGTNIAKNVAENIAETGFRSDPQMRNW